MGSSIIIDFLRESLNRLFSKSPKFFKIFQLVAGCLAFASYVPSMLQRWFGVEVPGTTITLCEDIAKYASGFFLAVLLPVAQKPTAQTIGGEAIKVTDETKMPFTAKVEAKIIEESVPPLPVKDVPEDTGGTKSDVNKG